MAHMIETTAWAGKEPWHELGAKVDDDLTPEQIMKLAGCDWTVSKRQMFYSSASKGGMDKTASRQKVDDHYALVRDTDHRLLDVVGSRYNPTQNKDAFKFFDSFVKECKLKMSTAGSLCGGQYVWALAKNEQSFDVAANDTLEAYTLLISPHKLGKSLIGMGTSVRVVCWNTLNQALQGNKAAFRMSHARKFDEQAKEEAATVLGLIQKSFQEYGEAGKFLAGKKATLEDAREFFGAVFKMDDKMIESEKPRKNGLLQRLLTAYEGGSPGADLTSAQGTWWGIFNACTFIVDHSSDASSRDTHLKDSWMGWRGDLKRSALDLALQMAA